MICLVYFFLSLSLSLDTESARASRRQLKDAIHAVLFDMNAPAVCAIDQVSDINWTYIYVCFLNAYSALKILLVSYFKALIVYCYILPCFCFTLGCYFLDNATFDQKGGWCLLFMLKISVKERGNSTRSSHGCNASVFPTTPCPFPSFGGAISPPQSARLSLN